MIEVEENLPKWGIENQFESKFVTLANGVKIHYVEAGPADAPVLLLTHGFLGSWKDWRYNVGALAEQSPTPLRTIAFDWPPFGKSDKPDIAYSLFYYADILRDFANALNLTEFDLMGHSMGGKHNLAFMLLNPVYVRKLILVDTDGFVKDMWTVDHTKDGWYQPISKLFTNILAKPKFLKLTLKNIIYNPKFYPPQSEIEENARNFAQPDSKAGIQAMGYNLVALSLTKTGLKARLGEIKNPTLIIWGKQDRLLHINCGYEARTYLPHAQFQVYEECGHLPQLEKAAEFNRLVLDFLAK